MGKYRKKPVIVEAVKFTFETADVVQQFCTDAKGMYFDNKKDAYYLVIPTLEGDHRADEGDYIIKGVNGEFYPCKPDIFAKTYEEVAD